MRALPADERARERVFRDFDQAAWAARMVGVGILTREERALLNLCDASELGQEARPRRTHPRRSR